MSQSALLSAVAWSYPRTSCATGAAKTGANADPVPGPIARSSAIGMTASQSKEDFTPSAVAA